MKNWKILWLSFLCVFLLSGISFGAYINDRPVAPDTSALQDNINAITTDGVGVDVVNDQIPGAIFNSTATGGSVATFIIEIAAYAGTNQFGIYEYSDPTNKAMIFDGPDGAGDQVTVTFREDGDILVSNNEIGGTTVLAATDFFGPFGFYLDVYQAASGDGGGDGQSSTLDYTLYSEDDRNGDKDGDSKDDAHALIIQGDNDTELDLPGVSPGLFTDNEYIIAFEDLLYPVSDFDFTDLVVMVESITPVPEPSTMIISSLFLIGAGFYVRRKLHNKA